jgi:hypothetical protein
MSLKITNTEGFKIGKVQNPSITEIYVRVLVDMSKQKLIDNDFISIRSEAKTTIEGGLFDNSIQVEGISPIEWLKYSTDVEDMNEQYSEIQEDLKVKLLESQPDWTIEIVTLGTL